MFPSIDSLDAYKYVPVLAYLKRYNIYIFLAMSKSLKDRSANLTSISLESFLNDITS